MLLLPLLENAFKHGQIEPNNNKFISLEINVEDTLFRFTLSNHYQKNTEKNDNASYGIGLNNVRKNLQLVYPDKHDFVIQKTGRYFYS